MAIFNQWLPFRILAKSHSQFLSDPWSGRNTYLNCQFVNSRFSYGSTVHPCAILSKHWWPYILWHLQKQILLMRPDRAWGIGGTSLPCFRASASGLDGYVNNIERGALPARAVNAMTLPAGFLEKVLGDKHHSHYLTNTGQLLDSFLEPLSLHRCLSLAILVHFLY